MSILRGSRLNPSLLFCNIIIKYYKELSYMLISPLIKHSLILLIPDTYSDKPIVTKVILLAFLGLSSVGFYEIICTIVKKRFSINLEEIYNNIVNDEGQKDEERDESSNQTPEDVPRDDIDIDIE